MIGNGTCNSECNNPSCSYDNGDCASQACSDDGVCKIGMIGNGVCNPDCYNDDCSYDGSDCLNSGYCSIECMKLKQNGYCDSECNIELCEYDGGDCECSPGCTTAKYNETPSDCANDPCNTEECYWHNYNCGKCAKGCFDNMLGNGVCDTDCKVENCNFDDADCGDCSPGCYAASKSDCSKYCMTLSCNWNQETTVCNGGDNEKKRKLYRYTQAIKYDWTYYNAEADCDATECVMNDLYAATSCEPKCNNASCGYSLGLCNVECAAECSKCYGTENGYCLECIDGKVQYYDYCFSQCPSGYSPDAYTGKYCAKDTDNSSLATPDNIYVINTGSEGTGTNISPYIDISISFTKAIYAYTNINLSKGVHTINPLDTTLEAYKYLDKQKPMYDQGKTITLLTIQPWTCAGGDIDSTKCYTVGATITESDRPTIRWTQLMTMTALGNSKLLIKNINLLAELKLIDTCAINTYNYCYYCPFTKKIDGMVYDQKSTQFTDPLPQSSDCSTYRSSNIIEVLEEATLEIQYSNILDFRFEPYSIIKAYGKTTVNLTNVNFKNIRVSGNEEKAAVVSFADCSGSNTPYGCGMFTYTTGTVSYLNNGYEIDTSLKLNGFLYAAEAELIEISDVDFEYNLVYSDTQNYSGLINVTNFKQLILLNVSVKKSILSKGIINILGTVSLSTDDSGGKLTDHYLTHIDINNLTVQNSYSTSALLVNGSYSKDLHNIQFVTTVVESSVCNSLISLNSKTLEKIQATGGNLAVSKNSEKYEYTIPPKTLTVTDLTITSCNLGTHGILLSKYYGNFVLDSINLNNISPCTISTCITDILKLDSVLYMDQDLTDSDPETQYLGYIYEFNTFQITDSIIQNYAFEYGSGCFYIYNSAEYMSGSVTVSNTDFTKITGYHPGEGSVFCISVDCKVSFSDCTISSNANYKASGYGAVYIFGDREAQVEIKDSVFNSNSGSSGGAIYCIGAKSLSITSTSFQGNSATSKTGGAISISPNDFTPTSLTIYTSTFYYNSANTFGGAISIENPSLYEQLVSIMITGSTFSSNTAYSGGNGIALIDKIQLSSSSSISNSYFRYSTNSDKGTVYVNIASGILTISYCQFIGNGKKYDSGSAVYIISEEDSEIDICYVSVENSIFTENIGDSIISVGDSTYYSTFKTKDCEFIYNQAVIVRVEYGTYSDENSTFISNTAESGPGLRLKSAAVAVLNSSKFQENTATDIGGAIHMSESSQLICNKCSFTSNKAGLDGGAIYTEQNSYFTLTSCTLKLNSCSSSGSAIYMTGCLYQGSTISISNIFQNTSEDSGTISLYNTILSIYTTSIYENISKFGSPGIDIKDSTLSLSSVYMYSQDSDLSPFIYSSTGGIIDIQSSEFQNGNSTYGGGFYLGSSSLNMKSTTMFSLTANIGAAIYMIGGSILTMTNSKIKDCTAAEYGVIYVDDSEITLINSEFENLSSVALVCYDMKKISIEECTFLDNSGELAGAIYIENANNLEITDSIFTSNSGTEGGAIYIKGENSIYEYSITSSQFTKNTARYGGAIHIVDADMSITSSVFTSNSATYDADLYDISGQGGGIYFDCSEKDECVYEVTQCKFTQNTAPAEGGGIKWTSYIDSITESNNQFVGNTAVYGPDRAAYGSTLSIEIVEDTQRSSRKTISMLEDVAPGQPLENILTISLKDSFGQVITTDYSSSCEIKVDTDSDTEYMGGITQMTAVAGVYSFDSLILYATPYTDINIEITTTAFNYKSSDATNKLGVSVRDCEIGEEKTVSGCTICAEGYYNTEAGADCEECPSDAKCIGGDKLLPKEGYWRSSIKSDKLYECLYEGSCLGGVETENSKGECEEGYKGNLCQSCKDGYGRTNNYECSKCLEKSENSLILIGIAVLIIIVEIILIRSSIKSAYEPKSLFSVYFKILVNYFQLMNIISTFDLNWPSLVLELFNVQSQVSKSTSQVISVDCSLEDNSEEPFYVKLLILMLLPIIASLIIIIVWCFIYLAVLIKTKKKIEHVYFKTLGSIITVFFLIHPQVLTYMFAAFNCMEIEDGEYWLMVDLDLECWQGHHLTYTLAVALPGLIVWGILIPALCLIFLIQKRNQLDNIKQKLGFGFLYLGFQKRTFYWEFVILYRKVLLITYSVFMRNYSINAQALTVLLTLIGYLYIQTKSQPYITKDLNKLETYAILVSAATIYAGLYYLTTNISNLYFRCPRQNCVIPDHISV